MTSHIKLTVLASVVTVALGLLTRAEYSNACGSKATTAPRESLGASFKSSDIIGLPVENESAADLGQLEDLAVNMDSGEVVHVIVGTGGFLKGGTHYIAVPPSEVRADLVHKILFLDVTAKRLARAPRFEADRWNDFYETDQWREASAFFGKSDLAGTAGGSVQRASKVIGLPVKNMQNEKIGTVANLMVDLLHNKVVAAIVSSGGFLGLGQSLSTVPLPSLKLAARHDQFQIDATLAELKKVSSFNDGEWPDFSRPLYVESIYRAYRLPVKPASDLRSGDAKYVTGSEVGADHRAIAPGVSGNSSDDQKITHEIRKAVAETKGLSLTAQNIKITTSDGRVVLRGRVRSPEEKQIIGDIASGSVFGGNVDNQLEVVQGTSSL